MSDEEKSIRAAYDSISMPAGLKQKTLQTIAERQSAAERQGSQQAQTQSQPAETASSTANDPWALPVEADSTPAPDRTLSVVRRNRRIRSFVTAAAACLVLAIVGIGGFSVYTTETAHVGIELNPSLELGLNRFDIVVSTRAYNDDAQAVLDETPLTGLSYDEAIDRLSSNTLFMSKATPDAFMDITISCDNEKQSQKLQNTSEDYIQSLPCGGTCYGVSPELYAEAQSHHMGTARYQAALTLIELDPSLSIEDCMNMTMSELRSRITAAGGEVPEGSYGNQHHQSQGSGQGQGAAGQGMGQGQGRGASSQNLSQGLDASNQSSGEQQGASGQNQGSTVQNPDTSNQGYGGETHNQGEHNQSQGTQGHQGYGTGHE